MAGERFVASLRGGRSVETIGARYGTGLFDERWTGAMPASQGGEIFSGAVRFESIPTGGYAGPGTEVWALHCCAACHDAGHTLPGHEAECSYDPSVAPFVDEGLLLPLRRDGEWRLEFTAAGVEALAAATQAITF